MCAAVVACQRGARGPSTPPDDELWIAPGSPGHTLARAEVRDVPQAVSAPGRYVEQLLERASGNKAQVARWMGVSYPTVAKKINDYGIDTSRWKSDE